MHRISKLFSAKCKEGEASGNSETKDESSKTDSRTVEEGTRQITLLVVGAGNRGNIYSSYAEDFPQRLKIVGVAEPQEVRRSTFQKRFNVPNEHVFNDWTTAAKRERFADAVLISTLDDLHRDPCIAFADLGYHILCEKPMATTEQECVDMVEASRRNDVILAIGHVLRYTQTNMAVHKMIKDGSIGEVVGIRHMEPVGWWHFAHSFVRGNWKKEIKDIGSLMAKSCHDLDLIKHFIGQHKCIRIQSFGSLVHFTAKNKPEGAADRCLDCKIEQKCPYSAVRQYVQKGLFVHAVTNDIPDIENIEKALRTGPYGQCVYSSDNDVCDYQTVNMEFEGGKYATFVMSAFTKEVCARQITIMGTRGQIEVRGESVTMFDFLSGQETSIPCQQPPELTTMRGHGYADYYFMKAFVSGVASGDRSFIQSGPEDSLRGHQVVFAAEKSRKQGGAMIEIDI